MNGWYEIWGVFGEDAFVSSLSLFKYTKPAMAGGSSWETMRS